MIPLDGDWESLFTGAARAALEGEVLPRFLAAQRWFGGKARRVVAVRLAERATLRGDEAPAWLQFVRVEYADGPVDLYFVPLAIAEANPVNVAPQHVLARLTGPHGEAALIDALADAACCQALLEAIERGRAFSVGSGVIRGAATAAFTEVRGADHAPLAVTLGPATSSNTLVNFGDRLLLKLFRRLDTGINPDFEMGRFLTEGGRFERTPKMAGVLEYKRPDGETTLAIAQQLVPNASAGWQHALGELRSFFAHAAERKVVPGLDGHTLLEVADTAPPAWVAEVVGGYLPEAKLLGRRTAEMHRALASDPSDPAFAPEPLTAADLATLNESMRAEARQALGLLGAGLERLPAAQAGDARRLLERAPAALDRLGEPAARVAAQKLRCHGDYHLGQVLWAEGDFWIIDFEGEPARPIEERRAKQSPLRDVAGMVRSLDYAAHAGLFARAQEEPADRERLAPWAELWQRWTSAAFLRQYRKTAAGAAFLPVGAEAFARLLDRFLLEKAFYELAYELNNRPDWVRIPLRGICALIV